MTVVDIEFKAHANFGQVATQIATVNEALKTMNTALRNAPAGQLGGAFNEFNNALQNSGQYVTSLHKVAAAEETWGKNMADNRYRLRDYSKELKNFATTREGMIRKLARQQVALNNAITVSSGTTASGQKMVSVNTPRGVDMTDFGNKTKYARMQAAILSEVVTRAGGKMVDLGKNTQWAGRQMMVGLSLPIAIAGAAAGKAFYDMDKGLVRLVKVYGDLGTNLSKNEIGKLREDVIGLSRELAQGYGASMQDTIALAGDFAAAGQQGVEMLNSTRAASRLATLGEVDRQAAMQTTLSLTTAFRVQTQDMAAAVDFLNAVENQTSLSLADMTEAIPKAGPVVKGLGGDFKDLALYMVAMKEGGINAAQGANAIKSGLVSIISPSKKATDYLKEFGINLPRIVKKNAGNITATIKELQAALEDLSPLDRQTALANLFGKYQVARMTALFDNLGKSGSQTNRVIELMTASTAELAQVANRELGTIANSASGQWNRALESFRIALASIGEQFLEIGTMVVNFGTTLVRWFGGMPDWLQNLITWGAILTAIVGPVVMVTGVFLNFLGTIIKAGAGLRNVFVRITGMGEVYNYMSQDMRAAQETTIALTETMFNQTKATDSLSTALMTLEGALQKIAGTAPIVAGEMAALQQIHFDNLMLPTAKTGVGTATQVGHTIRHDIWKQMFGGNSTYRGGLSLVGESVLSNQGEGKNLNATLFGKSTDKLKAFNPTAAINTAAAMEAMERTMTDLSKKIVGVLPETANKVKSEFGKAMVAAQSAQSPAALARIRTDLVAKLNSMADLPVEFGTTITKQFDAYFLEAKTAMAKEVARISAMDDSALRVAITEKIQGLDIAIQQEIMQMINDGVIDARTMLATITTAEEAAGRTGLPAVVTGKAGKTKTGRRFPSAYAAMYGDGTTADMNADVIAVERANVLKKERNAKLDAAVIKDQEKETKRRQFGYKGMGGKTMAVGMAASMGAMMIPQTDNSAANTAVDVLGGAGMGASIGMMGGPWGMLAGALIGGSIPGVGKLINQMGELGRATEAAFQVGEDAANRYGVSLKKISDISLAPMLGGDSGRTDIIHEIANAMNAQEEGSADRNLIDFVKGEGDVNSVIGMMKSRAAQLIIAGVKPEDVKNQIAAVLVAAGQEKYMVKVNAALTTDFLTQKGALQDQIADAMSKINPDAEAFRAKMQQAFGGAARAVMAEFGTGVSAQNTSLIPDDQRAQYEALQQEFARLNPEIQLAAKNWDDMDAAIRPAVEALATAAVNMPTDQFMQLAGTLDYSRISAQSFAFSFSQLENVADEDKAAMQGLADAGYKTQDMLRGITLVNAGLIASLNELRMMGPIDINVYYNTMMAQQGIVKSVGGAAKSAAQARADAIRARNQPSGGGGGGGGSSDTGPKESDRLEKRKKKIQDRYNKEIEAIKKADKAKQEAADNEKRRIEREKRNLQSLIDYRMAIAAGDFAGAAKIKIENDAAKKQDKVEDQERKQKSASEKRIAQLEKERDAALKAMDKKIEAARKAEQATDKAAKSGAASMSKAALASIKAWEDFGVAIETIMSNGNLTFAQQMDAIIRTAKAKGINLKSAVKTALVDSTKDLSGSFKGVGGEIFNVIKGDVAKAPWNLIGLAVRAAMAGNNALLKKRIEDIKIAMTAPTKENGQKRVEAAERARRADAQDNRRGEAAGGRIWGAGTATSDSIPAWLSNGEYVIKASSVAKYGQHIFDQLNAGRFAEGGPITGASAIGHNAWYNGIAKALFFAGGGAVKPSYRSGGNVSSGNMSVMINVMEPGCSAEEIVAAFERKVRAKQIRMGYSR